MKRTLLVLSAFLASLFVAPVIAQQVVRIYGTTSGGVFLPALVDSSGRLLVDLAGGTISPDAIEVAESTCAAPGLAGQTATTTGVAITATPSLLLCVGGNPIGTLTATEAELGPNGELSITASAVTSTAPLAETSTGLGTTSTAGITTQNTTAAAAGAQQISPGFDWVGQGWKTDATAASQEVRFRSEVLPVQGAANPTGTWKLKASINSGAYTEALTVTSAGVVAAASQFEASTLEYGDNMFVGPTNTSALNFQTANTARWQIDANGQFTSLTSGANLTVLAGAYQIGSSGSATSTSKIVKKVTGIADNTATDVLTVTVPNANHAATVGVTLLCSTGSTDAFESSRTATGSVVLARTTGVDTAKATSTLEAAQIATVGGGATLTLVYGVSANTGAVGATQTFTIQVTVDDSGNLGGNQCVVLAEVVNAEATGVTIS